MTTDIAVLERALMVMAICMVVQTLLFVSAGAAVIVAWRRASEAMAEARRAADAHVAELRAHLERITGRVDEAADALLRGSAAVDNGVSDVRDAIGTVRNSVGLVTSMVTAPRAALALGLWRGVQIWRRRRAERRVADAARPEMETLYSPKGDWS